MTELIASRDWLFGEYDYYVDTSHLVSILRFSLILPTAKRSGWQSIGHYSMHLSTMFQFRGDPFEDGFKVMPFTCEPCLAKA